MFWPKHSEGGDERFFSWGRTGNTAFQISLFSLCSIAGFYLSSLSAVSARGHKWYFGTLSYLEQPQKIRIQIIPQLRCDDVADVQSRDAPRRARPSTELLSHLRDRLLARTDKLVWINDY